jgi:hypothetical protein
MFGNSLKEGSDILFFQNRIDNVSKEMMTLKIAIAIAQSNAIYLNEYSCIIHHN